MFGPPKEMKSLATLLANACPAWNPRIMLLGSEMAVVIDVSSISRTMLTVRGGAWVAISAVFDENDEPIPQLSTTYETRTAKNEVLRMYQLTMMTIDRQYEKALSMHDDDPLVAIRDAARVNLPAMRRSR